MTEKEALCKYETAYFEAKSCVELSDSVNNWFPNHPNISIRDISYLSEMRANRINPQQATVVFIALVTFRRAALAD